MNLSSARNLNSPLLLFCPCGPSLPPLYCSVGHCPFTLVPPPPPPPAVYIHVLSAHMFISSHLLPCTRPFHQLTLNSPHSLCLFALGSVGVQRTGHAPSAPQTCQTLRPPPLLPRPPSLLLAPASRLTWTNGR